MSSEMLTDAAARTLIAERCRRAYLHEIRGGLQALSGAFELLARLARSGDGEAAVVDRAATIAKRALANHETAMLDMVKEITAASESPERIELAALVGDVLRLLRNDFAGRQIRIHFEHREELCVEAGRNQLRFMLLGLIARRLDLAPAGSEMRLHLAHREANAVLTIECACTEAQGPEPDLVVDLVQHWLASIGGRLEPRGAGAPGALDVSLPLRP
jgi:signal transduction histidine kinase